MLHAMLGRRLGVHIMWHVGDRGQVDMTRHVQAEWMAQAAFRVGEGAA